MGSRCFRHPPGSREHEAARVHCLPVAPNAIYNWIPKNACTTLRASVGAHNGWPAERWRDPGKQPVLPDVCLLKAGYTFAVLRDPLTRLASCFLHIVVDGLARKLGDSDSMTFREFVGHVAEFPHDNHHWAPQTSLLAFEDYDDWFRMEDFGRIVRRLDEKLGLKVVDMRSKPLDPVEGDFADVPVKRIRTMKKAGVQPTHDSLYDDRLRKAVGRIYSGDFDLLWKVA